MKQINVFDHINFICIIDCISFIPILFTPTSLVTYHLLQNSVYSIIEKNSVFWNKKTQFVVDDNIYLGWIANHMYNTYMGIKAKKRYRG